MLMGCEKEAPLRPATAQSSANAEASWFINKDLARVAAEHIALSPATEVQRRHNRADADTQRVFAGWQRLRSLTPLLGRDDQPFVYVANYQYGGWSLIAADAHILPLMGFSAHGAFEVERLMADGNLDATIERNRHNPTMPEGMLDWLETTRGLVAALRANPDAKNAAPGAGWDWSVMATNHITIPELPNGGGSGQGWRLPGGGTGGGGGGDGLDPLQPGGGSGGGGGGTGGGGGGGGSSPCTSGQRGPFLRTNWGQGCGYNDLTPNGNDANHCWHCPTGCVATAMAQVMNFHHYPNRNWAAMPVGGILLPRAYPEVSTLMRDCGTAVFMSYGNTSSGAIDRLIAPALRTVFRFSSADYLNGSLVNPSIDTDLNAGRPSLVGGDSDTSGHLWVCDGYMFASCTSTVNYNGNLVSITSGWRMYHMNWGWNGTGTAWFNSNDWSVTVGNTVFNYQYNHCAIVNIHP